MSSFLIKTANPPNPAPRNWVQTEAPDVYLYAGPALNLPGATIIGEWLEDGTPVQVNQAEYLAIRPLGNADGRATETLRYHYWLGEEPRQIGNPEAADPIERLYPTDNLPFEIIIDHYWYEQAEFSGWGFLAEIIGGAASRDPSVRAMAVYSDSAHTQYLWTGGAFQQGASRLGQVDSQGNPLTVWFSDTPPGFRTVQKTPWNLAVLWASVQEGTCVLTSDNPLRLQFWPHSQGYVPVEEYPAWVQPLGAFDAYRLGALVSHNGLNWENTGSDANVWEPGVFGWTVI